MTRPLFAVAGLLLAALAAPAQQGPQLPQLDGAGTELFRGLLDYHKIKPLSLQDQWRNQNDRRTIVIVLGIPARGINTSAITQTVLRNGGAVLIASDQWLLVNPYLPGGSVAISGNNVLVDPDRCLNGRASCPFVVPAQPGLLDTGPEWELFKGLSRIATNQPTFLHHETPSKYVWEPLARFPQDARNAPSGARLTDNYCFAVGGSGPPRDPFRCLVLSDPSIFSNQMLVATERGTNRTTDNLVLADRIVRWLKDSDGVNRTQCLFVESGVVRESFDDVKFAAIDTAPPPVIPDPPIPDFTSPEFQRKLTDSANAGVADWQARDGPNRTVAGGPGDDRRFVRALRVLAVMAALLVLFTLLRRVWAGRHDPDLPPVPTDTGRVAASGAPGSLARRKEEILQSGNYTDVVREYLRGLFAAQGLPANHDPDPWHMPPVQVTGKGKKPLTADLRTLWGLAFDPNPQPVTYTRWKELEPMIDDVRRAAEDGRWRFAPGGAA